MGVAVYVSLLVMLFSGYILLLSFLVLQSIRRQRVLRFFDSLIVNFRKSSDLLGPDAQITVDYCYYIGRSAREDALRSTYELKAVNAPVRAKHIFVGATDNHSPESNLQMLASMNPSATVLRARSDDDEPIVTTPSIMPYRSEANRIYLCVAFSPAIPVGATVLLELRFRRPGIWETLRRTGVDEGGYVVAALPPKKVTLRFRPPHGTPIENLHVNPSDDVSEDGITVARSSTEAILTIEHPIAGRRYGYVVACSSLRSVRARLAGFLRTVMTR